MATKTKTTTATNASSGKIQHNKMASLNAINKFKHPFKNLGTTDATKIKEWSKTKIKTYV
jgi:hypothetical protein